MDINTLQDFLDQEAERRLQANVELVDQAIKKAIESFDSLSHYTPYSKTVPKVVWRENHADSPTIGHLVSQIRTTMISEYRDAYRRAESKRALKRIQMAHEHAEVPIYGDSGGVTKSTGGSND